MNEIVNNQLSYHIPVIAPPPQDANFAATIIEMPSVTVNTTRSTVPCECFQVHVKLARRPQIIAIEKGYVLACRVAEPGVSGGATLQIPLMEVLYCTAEGLHFARGTVSGAVINYDDLAIREGLPQDAFDSRGYVLLTVIRGDDYADEGHP